MTKKELEIIAAFAAGNSNISNETASCLCRLAENAGAKVDLIDRNQYFASVLWCEQDIIDNLKLAGKPWSPENINTILSDINTDLLEDCSAGNEGIQSVIAAHDAELAWTEDFIKQELKHFPAAAIGNNTAGIVLDWFNTVGKNSYEWGDGENPIEAALTDMGYL